MKALTSTFALLVAFTASPLPAQVMSWSYGSSGTTVSPGGFTAHESRQSNSAGNFGASSWGTAGFATADLGMGPGMMPPSAWQMPEFPQFPGFPPAASRGHGTASSSAQQFSYSSSGRGLSATYRNTPAVDVVTQLAGLAGIDPAVSDQAWEVLATASPVTRSFERVEARAALESVLKDLELDLDERLGILTRRERALKRDVQVSERTLRTVGIERQLNSPYPLMAVRTPLGMFLQNVSLQLGTEVKADWNRLRLDPGTAVTIAPFSSRTMGESLKAGLASAGLEYRLEKGELVISRLAD